MKLKLLRIGILGCLTVSMLGCSLACAAVASNFSDSNWSSVGGFPGSPDGISAGVVDEVGNLYVSASIIGDLIVDGIAKWDGNTWTALRTGDDFRFGQPLTASGGDLYAVGYGADGAKSVAKWNAIRWSVLGVLQGDPDFVSVRTAIVSEGNVYVGGRFTMIDGVAATNIAKWDGTHWSALGSGVTRSSFSLANGVSTLAVFGAHLYVGGYFTTAGGVPCANIAKWNGSIWLALDAGVNNAVHALAASKDGLYVGGDFTRAGNIVARYVAKWDGATWLGLGAELSGGVLTLATSDTDLYAGGAFTRAGNIAANYIATWNGTNWLALGQGLESASGPFVSGLGLAGSHLFAWGNFTKAGEIAVDNIGQWNGDIWQRVGASPVGLNGPVWALAAAPHGVYAGGGFRAAGGSPANLVARWNGTNWSALAPGLRGTGSAEVRTLAMSGDDLYAGGIFNAPGEAQNIARWNGINWSALGAGMNDAVLALAVSGNDLYAAGSFTRAGGVEANLIAKWDGTTWSPVGSGIGGPPPRPPGFVAVYALAASSSDLYAGGIFTNAGGVAANHIAKWDGTNWSALGSGIGGGASPYVLALAVSGSNVYVGGQFTIAGGIPATRIAKWDGVRWSALGSGILQINAGTLSGVSDLAISGNDLYVAGDFTTASDVTRYYVAKWDGENWSALGSGMNSYMSALAVSGDDLFAGGSFTAVAGKVSAYVARAYLPDLPALSVRRAGPDLTVSWPSTTTSDFVLQQTTTLSTPPSWAPNLDAVTDDGATKSVTLRVPNVPGLFRLSRP